MFRAGARKSRLPAFFAGSQGESSDLRMEIPQPRQYVHFALRRSLFLGRSQLLSRYWDCFVSYLFLLREVSSPDNKDGEKNFKRTFRDRALRDVAAAI